MSEKKVTFTDELPVLLTVKEVADFLRLRRQTVRKWVYQKRIQFFKLQPGGSGSTIRIPRSELELLLSAGFTGADDYDDADPQDGDDEDEEGLLG